LSRDLFNNATEDVVAEVRVGVGGSGIVLEERLAIQYRIDVLVSPGDGEACVSGDFKTHELGIVGNTGIPPAAVPEEVAHGDIGQSRVRNGPGERERSLRTAKTLSSRWIFPSWTSLRMPTAVKGLEELAMRKRVSGLVRALASLSAKPYPSARTSRPSFHNGQGTTWNIPIPHELRNGNVESTHSLGAFAIRDRAKREIRTTPMNAGKMRQAYVRVTVRIHISPLF